MGILNEFSGIVHYVDGTTAYASRGRVIFRSLDGGESWVPLFTLPLPTLNRFMASTRLSRRLFRANIYHLRPTSPDRLVTLGFGAVFVIDTQARAVNRVCRIVGSRPLSLCDDHHALYYGEYRGNPERSSVHVWSSVDQGCTWTPVYVFNNIRHIHGVFFDPYTEWLWVTTGDTNEESGIWVTKDRFVSVEKVVTGSQQVRAITLLFDQESVFFGSDSPEEKNHLYRLDRRTYRIEQLAPVAGSVFFGCQVGNQFFFSTACEPSKVNRSRQVTVWGAKMGEAWHEIMTFQKDLFPMKAFQYGQVMFPAGPGTEGHLWLTPYATWQDQISKKIAIK